VNRPAAHISLSLLLCLPTVVSGGSVAAPHVEAFSPQGTVKHVRQVTARFSDSMVPLGDPRATPPPFDIDCPSSGSGRWVDSRTWVYDFASDLPAGVRCMFRLRANLTTLAHASVEGESVFGFSTGGPATLSSVPPAGDETIDEEQAFILTLDGEATAESVAANAWFRVDGIGERIDVRVLTGEERGAVLATQGDRQPTGPTVVLQAPRRFPSGTKVALVWGAGIATPSGVATEEDQVLEFATRPAFSARFYCERANADAQCIPLTPMNLSFSAPVAWELARQIVLVGPGDRRFAARATDEDSEYVNRVRFEGPFPESSTLRIELPAHMTDDAGRALDNAGEFPLTVKTDPFPPLAKFSSRFGIIESKAQPLLPVTLRNLEPVVHGSKERLTEERPVGIRALLQGLMERVTARARRIPPDRLEDILPWLQKVGEARRTRSVFGATPDAAVQSFNVPKPNGAKAFEVVGIPLDSPGLYVVELASPRLGASLLGRDAAMYVPTAALVTNLAVHFKWGRDNALAWVTALEDARPVAGARVSVLDCAGTVLWTGDSDARGVAHIDGLPARDTIRRCNPPPAARESQEDETQYYDDSSQTQALDSLNEGLLVVAQTATDLSFVHSSWNRGIEPFRFQLPSEDWMGPFVTHTIFDRPLFRAGETVHMKHIQRVETLEGFGLVPDADRPTTLTIRHEGSNERYDLPLTWNAQGAAETDWLIPRTAKLGRYQVLVNGPKTPFGPSERPSGTFRVEEFRVPLMKAVVKLPADPQVGSASVPVDVSVQYLAGGGAGQLPVLLRSQIRPRAFQGGPDFEHFTFANGPVHIGIVRHGEDQAVEAEGTTQPGPVRRQDLVLDAAGAARARIGDLPPGNTVRELLAEVEFRDPNGEVQTVSSTVPLWPARWLTGIQADSWAGSKDHVRARIAVVDVRGNPVPNAPVRVEMLPRKTYSYRKRLVGGFYGYEHVEETLAPVGVLCDGTTDARGLLVCEGRAPVDGSLVLQATLTDPEGKVCTAHTEVWVAGASDWWFRVEDSDRMDVLPEKKQYEPGETARFQVRMPFRSATALVTVEREGVLDATVVTLSGNQPVVEVPVTTAFSPNVFVSVLAVRGRVGDIQPTAMVDLGKPAWKLGIAEIRVGWQPHELHVTVTPEQPVYRVRETANVRIAVRSADGTPLPAGSEVAVAAVDEGLLELQPNTSWDLLAAMMGRRGYAVRTATAQMQVVGKRHYGLKALPLGGGGGHQVTRELFDTLLLWQARVPLDAQGNASVAVPLNDSLTSFRIAAVATAGVGRFGTGAASIRSTQDLMLLSGLAPLVREGDQFRAEFTLRNTTDQPMTVTVNGRADGLPGTFGAQAATLAPGQSTIVGWDVTAPPGVESLTYAIDATADSGATDHLRVGQSVRPAVPVRTFQSTLQRWDHPIEERVQRPADALPGRGGVQVGVAPTLTGGLDGVRAWMRSYPYTCLEQRVSRAVALHDAALWSDISAALPSFLDADGLLKFFPTVASGSEVLTAYVLAITTQAGLPIPPDVQSKMEAGLTGFVQGIVTRTSAVAAADLSIRKLAALAALAQVGKAPADLLGSIAPEPNLWPTAAVLDWWSVLQRVAQAPDREARLHEAERIVRARLTLQGTVMGFSNEGNERLWWLMGCPDTDAVRLVLELLQSETWHDDLPRLMRGALARQQRGHWECTVTNAWGTLAVDKFASVFESTPVTGTVTATLGGAAQSEQWARPPAAIGFEFPWPDSPQMLSVGHDGTGAPWVTIASRAAIPLTQPLFAGYQISKTVTPLEARDPRQPSRGDLLLMRLEIDAQSDMTWVVVDDPIPAGASHIGTGLARDRQSSSPEAGETPGIAPLPPAFIERSFDAFRAYYEFVPKGRFVVEHAIRLNQSGRFELPPTRVEALYAPEMFGELPNARLAIAP
jgi:uncharacterized protein YfaS (alpha-2-macroglobulin family)